MLTVTKRFEFEAAHNLPKHPGKCKQLHGHSYQLEVEIGIWNQGRILDDVDPDTGMIMDFGDLKQIVQETIIERMDHHNLNAVLAITPTAELMVMWIRAALDQVLTSRGMTDLYLARVRLWETSNSYAEWKLR